MDQLFQARLLQAAIELGANCAMALHEAGTLDPARAESLAASMRNIAQLLETISPDELPSGAAVKLHSMAKILEQEGRSRPTG